MSSSPPVQSVNESNVPAQQRKKRKRAQRFVRNRQSNAGSLLSNLVEDDQYKDENKAIFAELTAGGMKLVKRTSKRGKPTKSKCWQLFRLIQKCNTNTVIPDRVFCVGCVKLFQ